MMKLTKKQLKIEIVTQANNIQVYETLIGDAGEAKNTLALLRLQLHDIELAELNASLAKK